ncbi:FtsW/RodA/SpoVE family cell cycle protein [Coraliomargarita sp. SDUM461004]|uniref:FtsW/RodA/SpoVE family cell cycle protein n=1 Tax=Thalassobacterium sedimentorum TaxID=3041258 RepID=A0ABU1AIW3_9BACT|nr:FtsW/RodA/SpoVE family cell cycle protein [Coraliomargarita sp. SDUM461004]MDQ8194713.1 FtsW/RodA/SpoVE family cell cycle protein [Coraliomargarita sp. SDUM461004]
MSVYRRIFSKKYQNLMYPGERLRFDIINPLCIFLLCSIGLLFIYSAQISYDGGHWKRQLFFILVGVGSYTTISAVNYKLILQYAHFIYIAGIFGLLLTMPFSPISVDQMGARRWIDVGIRIQPTEGAKIGTLIMAASILARSEIGTVKDSLLVLTKVAAVFLLPMLLIFLQPDLGSSLVFPPMIFALLYVSRLSEKFFLSAFAAFAIALAVLGVDLYGYSQHLEAQREAKNTGSSEVISDYQSLLPIHNYQRNRILTFVAPDVVDPTGTGASWNANQAKISAATGGWSGKGYLKGTQAQLGYLPQAVAHNDFIFSVIAEETGFLGSAFVVGLFCLMVANGIRIAGLARDRFGMQLAIGVSILFLVHFFINIGMTIGITPITGLPLPFLSYGGSFVLSCFILQGLVQSVYRYRKDFS